MKIQCDVCDKDEASVFCAADEAALCAACDRRVHHANKLAGKHHRFSLHHQQPPVCDICQEKRAFLFCQQDRAILCRECDLSIHRANEHTQRHARFLLTGLKLSANSISTSSHTVPNFIPHVSKIQPNFSIQKPCSTGPTDFIDNTISSSSISEYLIETLPGWHVEELLDSTQNIPSPCKSGENNVVRPFWDGDFESGLSMGQKTGQWGPQVNQEVDGMKEMISKKFGRKWNQDSTLIVPQMMNTASKRLRP